MLARRSALPVDDWILTPAGKKHKKHHLLKLFDDLDACDQYALNEYYARFQSLHNYIEEPTLRSFLCKVSDQGKGYERWRYALVNATAPNDLPRNSADAMLAIWSASVYLIQHRQNATGFMMPDAELWEMLDEHTSDPVLRGRMEQGDHPLNACAQLLWEEYREIANPKELLSSLREWVCRIDPQRDSGLSYFADRARGLTSRGSGIRWNEATGRFEDVPWTLELIEVDEKPEDTREIHAPHGQTARQGVLRLIYRHGFEVRERAHDRHKAEEDHRRCGTSKWQCTVLAKKARTSGNKLMLRVWEHRFVPYIRVSIDGEPGDAEQMYGWCEALK